MSEFPLLPSAVQFLPESLQESWAPMLNDLDSLVKFVILVLCVKLSESPKVGLKRKSKPELHSSVQLDLD